MSKYGVFSGPYFAVVRMGKIQARKNSVFGHFSRSVSTMFQWTPNVKELCEHYYWSVLSKEIQKKKTIKHPKNYLLLHSLVVFVNGLILKKIIFVFELVERCVLWLSTV